jgi:crotonobetainyl-CoA:carnitine CoA-transferase CaiB-like acyl-CoA transferase
MVQEMDDPEAGRVRFVANPIRMSETPASYDRPPPHLGEHNAEVLQQWLDLDPAELEQLAAKASQGG